MMILIVKFLLTMMWESLTFTANIIRAKVDVVAAIRAVNADGNDGFFTLQKNGNGLVDDATEIFGSTNVDGFNVLERLDSNADGKIDANDEKFAELKVWQDTNGNGVVDAGEMQSLTALGITSIDLNRVKSGVSVNGNTIGYTSTVTFADGSTSTAGTAYFATDGRNSTRADTTPSFTPAADVTNLPQLPGSGSIYSIAYRASNDAGFKTAWTALTDNAGTLSPQELRAQFTSLLLKWAGVDSATAGSRGAFVDAGHLAFVEAFFGSSYTELVTFGTQSTTLHSPSSHNAGAAVEGSFQHILDVMETMFLAQVAKSDLARGATLTSVVDNPYFFYSLLDFRTNVAANDNLIFDLEAA